jgi:predicted dehydrogenase
MRRGDSNPVRVEIPERVKGEFTDMPDYYTPVRANFTRMMREFVNAIREDRPAVPNFHDGVRVQRVMDAVIESGQSKAWTAVK